MSDEKPQVCKRLRSRMYYVVGRDAEDLQRSASDAQYWCAKTATVLGPDDVYCSPELCRAGRACFEPDEHDS
jgi:hypothetical protein